MIYTVLTLQMGELHTQQTRKAWNPSVNALSPLHSSCEGRAEERSGDKAFTDGFQANSSYVPSYISSSLAPHPSHSLGPDSTVHYRTRHNSLEWKGEAVVGSDPSLTTSLLSRLELRGDPARRTGRERGRQALRHMVLSQEFV
ncbi:hypothetical protein Bbelb_208760 [Branchiostoma belcheri]|nr:hypothetical protein Bbelb_208760 [Branchiostoma belcheri]